MIPDVISYSFSFISLCLAFINIPVSIPEVSLLLAGPILAMFFLFLWFVTKGRGVGLGDAKLALGIGWLLGLSGGIASVLMAFWIGTIVSLMIMFWQKLRGLKGLSLKSEIPFGPFLILGLYISFFGNITFETISAFLTF
jgi:leader peptidase (prepilin peptidase)/N-methyltransferase